MSKTVNASVYDGSSLNVVYTSDAMSASDSIHCTTSSATYSTSIPVTARLPYLLLLSASTPPSPPTCRPLFSSATPDRSSPIAVAYATACPALSSASVLPHPHLCQLAPPLASPRPNPPPPLPPPVLPRRHCPLSHPRRSRPATSRPNSPSSFLSPPPLFSGAWPLDPRPLSSRSLLLAAHPGRSLRPRSRGYSRQ